MFQRFSKHRPAPPSSRTRPSSRRDPTGRQVSEGISAHGTRLSSRLDPEASSSNGSRINPSLYPTYPGPPEASPSSGTRLNSRLDSSSHLRDAISGAGRGSSSTFKTQHDIEMASKQTQYDQLSAQERALQETWAQIQLRQNSSRCPAGLAYIRKKGGYECAAALHFVTDELLAEGKGRYLEKSMVGSQGWAGPYPRKGREGRIQRGQEGLFGIRRIGR